MTLYIHVLYNKFGEHCLVAFCRLISSTVLFGLFRNMVSLIKSGKNIAQLRTCGAALAQYTQPVLRIRIILI